MKWAQTERLGVWDPGPYPFSRQCQIFHFRTYPEFETLSRFRDKIQFSRYEYHPQFKTKLTVITYKRNQ